MVLRICALNASDRKKFVSRQGELLSGEDRRSGQFIPVSGKILGLGKFLPSSGRPSPSASKGSVRHSHRLNCIRSCMVAKIIFRRRRRGANNRWPNLVLSMLAHKQPSRFATACGLRPGQTTMKMMILIAIAALGIGAANAETRGHGSANSQTGDQFNFTRGGGG